MVPVQAAPVSVQPWFEHAVPVRLLHGVIVPVHVLVPGIQEQPLFVQIDCELLCVEHAVGVPAHVPPTPVAVHVHPSSWHCVMLFTVALVQYVHVSGVPEHVPVCTRVHPWHSMPPQRLVGHVAHVE
jgi:hypothetical protein